MSTRCQVQVIQEGLEWDQKIMLYHHTDGYPSNMIKVIKKAYEHRREPFWKGDSDTFESWRKGRAGKVASYLCWADPGVFEPEDNHRLHSDIEYFYRLYCINDKNNVSWEVEIFTSHNIYTEPLMENLCPLLPRTPLEDIDGEEVEERENELYDEGIK